MNVMVCGLLIASMCVCGYWQSKHTAAAQSSSATTDAAAAADEDGIVDDKPLSSTENASHVCIFIIL